MENQAEHAEVSLVDVALVLPQASNQYHKCTTSGDPVAEDWEIMRLSVCDALLTSLVANRSWTSLQQHYITIRQFRITSLSTIICRYAL